MSPSYKTRWPVCDVDNYKMSPPLSVCKALNVLVLSPVPSSSHNQNHHKRARVYVCILVSRPDSPNPAAQETLGFMEI